MHVRSLVHKIYACVHGSMHEIDIYIHTPYIVGSSENEPSADYANFPGRNIKVDACNETVRVIKNSGSCNSDPMQTSCIDDIGGS